MNFKLALVALVALVSTVATAELMENDNGAIINDASLRGGRELGVDGTSNKESCMYYYYKRTGCAKKWAGICWQDKYGKLVFPTNFWYCRLRWFC